MSRWIGLLFILGFVFLIKGADMLVEGASSLAKKCGISDMVIGLTIVAFGTSAPELVVNVTSSLQGATGITIGNVLGSNIANILLILGAAAVITPITVQKKFLSREVVICLAATLVFAIFINDARIDGAATSRVSRSEGIILILLLLFFVYYLFATAKRENTDTESTIAIFPLRKSLLWIGLGLVGLLFGGERIVNGAVAIATSFWLSERLIGLTIIAVGTSLPELATSLLAAYRKNADIALGNVIGSNVFNILFILGVSAVIAPIPALPGTNNDLILLIVATLLIFIFGATRGARKGQIGRVAGSAMLLLYVVAMVSRFFLP